MAQLTDDPVIVIGGGLAGLSAATALAEAGRPVVVLEGRGALGGRAQSFTHRRTGDELDTGQHVLMGCYYDMFRFLDRVGTRDLVRIEPTLRVVLAGPGGLRGALSCPALPTPLHLAIGLARHRLLSWTDEARTLRVLRDVKARSDDPALDRLTVSEWLKELGQSENACPRELRHCFVQLVDLTGLAECTLHRLFRALGLSEDCIRLGQAREEHRNVHSRGTLLVS